MIRSSRRWEMGVYDWFEDLISIQGIKMEVLMLWIKSRPDVRAINDALSIISQDLKSHGMTNMFRNTNPMTAFLMGIQREIRIINLVVDGFIEPKIQQGTDISGGASESLKGKLPLRAKVDVLFRRKQTYIKQRSHKEASEPV
jgi:hypothetical protein